jgi:hypothetical protein
MAWAMFRKLQKVYVKKETEDVIVLEFANCDIKVLRTKRVKDNNSTNGISSDASCSTSSSSDYEDVDQQAVIAEQLKTLFHAANKVNLDKIVILPGTQKIEYKLVHEHYQSTNDLLIYPNIPIAVKVTSFFVIVTQIVVFGLVLHSTRQAKVVKARSVDLIVIRLFISLYLALHLANSVSSALFRLFPRTETLALRDYALNTIIWPVIAVVICSFVHFVGAKSSQGWTFEKKLLLASEMILMMVSIIATAIITKQQGNIVSSIFNFMGLLLILELDDLMARVLPFKLTVARFDEEAGWGRFYDNKSVKFSMSISLCIWLGIYLVV